MTAQHKPLISAQAVLRAASGKSPQIHAPITSAELQEFMPTAETLTNAKRAFSEAGFDIGNLTGNSLTIIALPETFEKVFNVSLRPQGEKIVAIIADGVLSDEIPKRYLPPEIAAHVEVIMFGPPPEFGPANF